MFPAPKINPVRRFTEQDIPQVADLHRTVFAMPDRPGPELLAAYRAYFDEVFFNNPWRDESVGPLVYEDPAGRITGFLGVSPRRLTIGGKSVQMAIMSQFVVDANSRGVPGMKLLSAYFAGPQDLNLADEASATVRGLWEGLGGYTSLPQSMRWFYAVRPCHFALLLLKKMCGLPASAVRIAAPLSRAADALAARLLKFPHHPVAPSKVFGEEMTNQTMLACLAEAVGKQSLRPDYDEHSLDWTLRRAAGLRRNGNLQKVVVRTEDQKIAGWYVYYLNPAGISQVLQLHAKPHFADQVLDHLFYNAWRQGAAVLSGRLEPDRRLTQAFSDKHCLFHCGPEWVMFQSRRPELVSAFHRGDLFLSRLDGEWCTHFR